MKLLNWLFPKSAEATILKYRSEEVQRENRGIDAWSVESNPAQCSRCMTEDHGLTVDSQDRPVCWCCVGFYGLSYDHSRVWNPETRSVEYKDASRLGDRATGAAKPLPF